MYNSNIDVSALMFVIFFRSSQTLIFSVKITPPRYRYAFSLNLSWNCNCRIQKHVIYYCRYIFTKYQCCCSNINIVQHSYSDNTSALILYARDIMYMHIWYTFMLRQNDIYRQLIFN